MIFGNSQVQPLKSGQVRPIAKLAPDLHTKYLPLYFVKGAHIMDPNFLRVHI